MPQMGTRLEGTQQSLAEESARVAGNAEGSPVSWAPSILPVSFPSGSSVESASCTCEHEILKVSTGCVGFLGRVYMSLCWCVCVCSRVCTCPCSCLFAFRLHCECAVQCWCVCV